jgi:hypothetical protein
MFFGLIQIHVGPYLLRYPQFCVSLRLLHVRIDSFRIFGDDLVYRKQP